MINEEETLEATPERKNLLKAMADTRGNFAAATAQLRTYLLSGDKSRQGEIRQASGSNFEKGFAAVGAQKGLLTAGQRASLRQDRKARAEFAPLHERIFGDPGVAHWNVPGAHPRHRGGAPRAEDSRSARWTEGGDGTRSGGIKTNQKKMLAEEASAVQASIAFLTAALWGLLAMRPRRRRADCAFHGCARSYPDPGDDRNDG